MVHPFRGDAIKTEDISRTVDLVLTGHTHDLYINYDGRNARWSSPATTPIT